jgi:phosphoribosylformimino-5-aminoimidazole carboxamide ribotide isomerase
MTLFRPCIDLHDGHVKQIVGGSLRDGSAPKTNFVASHDAAWYANLYKDSGLKGGHVILLGPGNDTAAKAALKAYPGGLQVGGGITDANAPEWLDAGASHVIVTSWLFPDGALSLNRLRTLSALIGPDKLVVDLSCRRVQVPANNTDGADGLLRWNVAINRWQTVTDVTLDRALFESLDPYCDEYLIHAADVEGLRQGLDWKLIAHLSGLTDKPLTYAGGASSLADLTRMNEESQGRMDLTIGSALDIFGGSEVTLQDCIAFNRAHEDALQGRTTTGDAGA